MADLKITELTAHTTAIGADVFPVVDTVNAITKKITLTNLKSSMDLGSLYQPLDTDLTAIAALSSADSNFIVGSAGGWVAESGATVRTSLGLGMGDSPTFKGETVLYSANYFNKQWGETFNHADYYVYETGNYGVGLGFFKAGGTFAVPTLVGADETIAQWIFYGQDDAGFHQAAIIRVSTDSTPGNGADMPGKIQFLTTPNGSITSIECMRINSAGLVTVTGNMNNTGVYQVDGVQVVGNRVVDARCDDAINSGDATTDGVIDALRDAMIQHGLISAS